eukprot:TRINITY_DN1071_c0_g1_i6.p1 TRINITY_DN1071_c0_g1~~TRINITY_DN1071_c0_g1_i6.p1  ORF type:complete len:238 (-),score=108.34 TRINITY_DN1071_c0_g1_i6:80-793(-)
MNMEAVVSTQSTGDQEERDLDKVAGMDQAERDLAWEERDLAWEGREQEERDLEEMGREERDLEEMLQEEMDQEERDLEEVDQEERDLVGMLQEEMDQEEGDLAEMLQEEKEVDQEERDLAEMLQEEMDQEEMDKETDGEEMALYNLKIVGGIQMTGIILSQDVVSQAVQEWGVEDRAWDVEGVQDVVMNPNKVMKGMAGKHRVNVDECSFSAAFKRLEHGLTYRTFINTVTLGFSLT